MNRFFALITALALIALSTLIAFSCAGRGDQDDESLAPFLYQDTFEIWPDPAQLYEDAEFYVGWKDHDGDMEYPVVLLYLVNEQGDQVVLEAENIDIEGEESGSLSFTVRIGDGYQGNYFLVVQDEDGNASNEVTSFLYVNTVPPEDDDDTPYDE